MASDRKYETCAVCEHTPAHCNCKRDVISVAIGGVPVEYASVLPKEIITRIDNLAKKMRDDHRDGFAAEVDIIWRMCERAFAAEFDAGFEHAQLTVEDWDDPDPESDR